MYESKYKHNLPEIHNTKQIQLIDKHIGEIKQIKSKTTVIDKWNQMS